jgi:hypothetical protein
MLAPASQSQLVTSAQPAKAKKTCYICGKASLSENNKSGKCLHHPADALPLFFTTRPDKTYPPDTVLEAVAAHFDDTKVDDITSVNRLGKMVKIRDIAALMLKVYAKKNEWEISEILNRPPVQIRHMLGRSVELFGEYRFDVCAIRDQLIATAA